MERYWQKLTDDVLSGSYQQSQRAQKLKSLKSDGTAIKSMKKRYSNLGPSFHGANKRAVFLGKQYSGIYLTPREGHCAMLLLHGCTSKDSAQHMHLSPRTVEYYLGNIKSKLGVRRKAELIAALLSSDFLENFQYIEESEKLFTVNAALGSGA